MRNSKARLENKGNVEGEIVVAVMIGYCDSMMGAKVSDVKAPESL